MGCCRPISPVSNPKPYSEIGLEKRDSPKVSRHLAGTVGLTAVNRHRMNRWSSDIQTGRIPLASLHFLAEETGDSFLTRPQMFERRSDISHRHVALLQCMVE